MQFRESAGNLMEAGSRPNETHILILEEGMGNPKNRCYYGPEAIDSAAEVFRGVRMFANHPGKKDIENRPERDVEDIVGRVRDTYVKTGDNGRKQCWGVAKVVEGDSCKWIKERINESVKAIQEGFAPIMQVSINADGDTEQRAIEGQDVNYVTRVKRGFSVDFVPMGGILNAGFKDIMESNTLAGGDMKTKKKISPEELARFKEVNQKVEKALSSDEMSFLESMYERMVEADNADLDGSEDAGNSGKGGNTPPADETDGETVAGDTTGIVDADAPQFSLTLEDGSTAIVGEPHGHDNNGNPMWELEDGRVVTMDASAAGEAEDEPLTPIADVDEEDVDFDALRARFPQLAAEIEKAERSAQARESHMNVDDVIGNLRETRRVNAMERSLLESRLLAETMLTEARVDPALLTPEDLIGCSPDDMKRKINKAMRLDQLMEAKVQALHGTTGTTLRESRSAPNLGKTILAAAIRS